MCVFLFCFLAFDFCRFYVVIRFFHPRHNSKWTPTSKGFLYQILSITLFSYLYSWERASISLFQCWVLNKGTTGTIFITSLVWRGHWLGIEPGTSNTRSQHYTTSLSRRRCETYLHIETIWSIVAHCDCASLLYFGDAYQVWVWTISKGWKQNGSKCYWMKKQI